MVQIVPFVDESFNKLVFSPILPPHSHVILHEVLDLGCRIHILKSEKKLLPGARFSSGRLRVLGKALLSGYHSPSMTVPFSLKEGVIFLMMDSATSPLASCRMTGWEGCCEELKFSE